MCNEFQIGEELAETARKKNGVFGIMNLMILHRKDGNWDEMFLKK